MKRSRWIILALVIVVILGIVGSAYGVGLTEIDWFVFGGGGGPAQSSGGGINMNATLGQTAIGNATSSGGVGIGSGYWYAQTRMRNIYLPVIMR